MHIYFLIFIFLVTACEKQSVSYERIFMAELGFEEDQIGSNIPILESYDNRKGLPDSFFTETAQIRAYKDRVYAADAYNKRVSIFSTNTNIQSKLLFTISNTGEGYEFARPYEVFTDSDENIYVLASVEDFESYEVQHYGNQTEGLRDYDKFLETINNIPAENFHIYKFSKNGKFISKFQENSPFAYPALADTDNLGNLYIGFDDFADGERIISINKFNPFGELISTFSTDVLDLKTNINDTEYIGKVVSAANLKNQNAAALMIEYQPNTNSAGQPVPPLREHIYSGTAVYDWDEQSLSQNISQDYTTELIMGVDKDDRIFSQSYDEENDALKITILDEGGKSVYYTPLHSDYYILFEYFIDNDGKLYNYLIDRNEKLILLQWNIENEED